MFSVWKSSCSFGTLACHLLKSVKHKVQSQPIPTNSTVFILGGLTSLVQPADVCWNKQFKKAYRHLYDVWTANGKKKPHSLWECESSGEDQALVSDWFVRLGSP